MALGGRTRKPTGFHLSPNSGKPRGGSHTQTVLAVRYPTLPYPTLGCAQDQCAFNGAWGGTRKPTAFYVSSYFWDRATDAGIIADEAAITWTLKPADLGAVAEKACAATAAGVPDLFPKVGFPFTAGSALGACW